MNKSIAWIIIGLCLLYPIPFWVELYPRFESFDWPQWGLLILITFMALLCAFITFFINRPYKNSHHD